MPTVTVVVGTLDEKKFRGVEVSSQQPIVLQPMRAETLAFERWRHRPQQDLITEVEREMSVSMQQSEMYRQQEEMIYRFLWA